MLEFIDFQFDKHINFILDCLDEASHFSWPELKRIEKARELDYEYFKSINLKENIVYLAYKKEEIIGFIWCSLKYNKIEERKYCHVNFVYISPNHRQQGYGKSLMNKIEEIALQNEASIISLEVTTTNTSAVKLYENEGYHTERYIMNKVIN